MVKKKKEETPKVKEQKVKSFIDYKVFEDHSATIEIYANDKEILALMLTLYKRLDDDARKVMEAVIRTLSLVDEV